MAEKKVFVGFITKNSAVVKRQQNGQKFYEFPRVYSAPCNGLVENARKVRITVEVLEGEDAGK